MKNLRFAILIAIIVLVSSLSDTLAQRGENRQYRMKEQLNLTEDQQNKIETMSIEHRKNMVDLRAEMEKAVLEMRQLKNSDNFNRLNFNASREKIDNIQNRISDARANHWMDVYEMLSADQQKIWRENKRGFDRGEGPNFKHGRGEGYRNGKGMRMGRGGFRDGSCMNN